MPPSRILDSVGICILVSALGEYLFVRGRNVICRFCHLVLSGFCAPESSQARGACNLKSSLQSGIWCPPCQGWKSLSPGSTLSTLSRHSLDTVDTVDTGVNRHHLDTTSTPPTLVSTSVDIRDALMLSTGVKSVNLVSMVSS